MAAIMRSRGTTQRPFTRVDALRVAAAETSRASAPALVTRLAEAQSKFDDAQKKTQTDGKGANGAEGTVVLTPEQKQKKQEQNRPKSPPASTKVKINDIIKANPNITKTSDICIIQRSIDLI